MDRYIKMCREATDIQDAWEPKEGDAMGRGENTTIVPRTVATDLKDYFTWLPRIEDLIEIYRRQDGGKDYTILCDLTIFIKTTAKLKDIYAPTNEWMLRLIMYSLYNKLWREGAWIYA